MEIIVEDKAALRDEIGLAVASFLKRGGKVEQHPIYSGRDGALYGDFAQVIKGDVSEANKKNNCAWVPDAGYVNIRQMTGMTGLAGSSFRSMVRRGALPPPCKVGHKRTQWWRIERVQPIIDKIKARSGVKNGQT